MDDYGFSVDSIRQGLSVVLYEEKVYPASIQYLNAAIDRLAKAEALAEALRKLEQGDIPRPVGSAWFPDGRASKHDRCVHDVWMYEVCEGCQDAFIAAALKAWETPST